MDDPLVICRDSILSTRNMFDKIRIHVYAISTGYICELFFYMCNHITNTQRFFSYEQRKHRTHVGKTMLYEISFVFFANAHIRAQIVGWYTDRFETVVSLFSAFESEYGML